MEHHQPPHAHRLTHFQNLKKETHIAHTDIFENYLNINKIYIHHLIIFYYLFETENRTGTENQKFAFLGTGTELLGTGTDSGYTEPESATLLTMASKLVK